MEQGSWARWRAELLAYGLFWLKWGPPYWVGILLVVLLMHLTPTRFVPLEWSDDEVVVDEGQQCERDGSID